jgi:hypothetical protein
MLASLLLSLVPQAVEPNAENYRQWLTFIQPDAKEQAYKEIDWRNKFWDAVQEAKGLGRPILLWTMNGHPLGCT